MPRGGLLFLALGVAPCHEATAGSLGFRVTHARGPLEPSRSRRSYVCQSGPTAASAHEEQTTTIDARLLMFGRAQGTGACCVETQGFDRGDPHDPGDRCRLPRLARRARRSRRQAPRAVREGLRVQSEAGQATGQVQPRARPPGRGRSHVATARHPRGTRNARQPPCPRHARDVRGSRVSGLSVCLVLHAADDDQGIRAAGEAQDRISLVPERHD